MIPICSFSTFVYIKTDGMCPFSTPSSVATAVKSPREVKAGGLRITDIWVLALISVVAGFAIEGPTHKSGAFTAIGPWCVDALRGRKTFMRAKKAFISVLAYNRSAIPLISREANTRKERRRITIAKAM